MFINNSNITITPILESLRLEDIDDDVYFSEKYSEYISNSRLKLINPDEGGSPEKFFEGLGANKIYSDSLVFGSAIHELVLQPESFTLDTKLNRPTGKCGFIADIIVDKGLFNYTNEDLINAAIEVDYYHGLLSDNQLAKLKDSIHDYVLERSKLEKDKSVIYLDPKSREKLSFCIDALQKNPKIGNLLNPKGILEDPISANEKTILLDVEVKVDDKEPFILRLKSKLDNYTIDKETGTITVNDLKTTGKIVKLFGEAIDNYHYFRELSMYSWLLSLCAEKFFRIKNPVIKGNFLVVSTVPEYYTKVVPMTKSLYNKGWEEFKRLLSLVAYYKAYGTV